MALTLLAFGCTSVDSDNILTSGIYASVKATADGTGTTRVSTTLYLENPSSLNFIELEGDDRLTAYAPDGDVAIMREAQLLGITSYSATFDIDDGGSEFIVEFSRSIDDGAPDSRVFLPEPFDILNAEAETYSRAEDDLVIEWAPTSIDDVDVTVRGFCIQDYATAVEGDPGILTIEADTLQPSPDPEDADECDLTIEVIRSTPGDVDPAYGYGGDAAGRQIRQLSASSTP